MKMRGEKLRFEDMSFKRARERNKGRERKREGGRDGEKQMLECQKKLSEGDISQIRQQWVPPVETVNVYQAFRVL